MKMKYFVWCALVLAAAFLYAGRGFGAKFSAPAPAALHEKGRESQGTQPVAPGALAMDPLQQWSKDFQAEKEPSIREVHQAAIRYAEVMPGKIRGWRAGAMWRSWLPKFTLSLDRSKDQTIASSSSGGKTTFSVGPEDESFKLGFGFTWDFANLIWNPDQVSIDNRSRLMVQLRREILEEVTRVYFERRRLCAEFEGNPTADALLLRERRLRVEELTAQLDALTGGWFSLHASLHK